jgi:STE24 endopeptidase
MNSIAALILFFILFETGIHIIADVLNLKHLKNDIPDTFKDVYDEERYRQSQSYLRVNTRFGWFTTLFNLMVLIVFWFGKGFPFFDRWAQSWGGGPVVTGLIFIAALSCLKMLLSLPFAVYSTFVIEERFGFNKTRWSTFIMDLLKGLALSLLLGGPIAAVILWFFEYAGPNAWWICWMTVSIYMLVVQFIAPAWIMPWFNKFTPLQEGPLRQAIIDYARKIGFSLDNIYIIDGSRRSSKSNAFFTGFGRNKRIALFDTLVEQHSDPELVSILAHEMGHYKKRHIIKMVILGIVQTGVIFFLLSIFISYQGLFDAFYMNQPSVYAGFIFFAMLWTPIDFITGLFVQILSRKNEYEADRFAVETITDRRDLIEALKKLSVHNLSNLGPHPFYVFLNYSHPPILDRIQAIQKS